MSFVLGSLLGCIIGFIAGWSAHKRDKLEETIPPASPDELDITPVDVPRPRRSKLH